MSVQIAAETSAGVGPPPKKVFAFTKQDCMCLYFIHHVKIIVSPFYNYIAPSVPRQPVIEVVNATAVIVSWLIPDHPSGIIRENYYNGFFQYLQEIITEIVSNDT